MLQTLRYHPFLPEESDLAMKLGLIFICETLPFHSLL
jgi:hypothetical protein